MSDVTATCLRCEYLTDPLAIDTDRPRLSWILQSQQRGIRQGAYQILVARERSSLDRDEADVWDSGQVASDETAHVPYTGDPLASGQLVFWKVRVWTGDGQPSTWSETARWRSGLRDFAAGWIGVSGPLPDEKPYPALPAQMLRKTFSPTGPVKRAFVTASALGVYELRINGRRVGDHLLAPEWTDYHKRVQYQAYDVTDLLQSGENAIGATLGDGWYVGRLGISHVVEGGRLRGHYGKRLQLLAQVDIELADGTTQTVVTDESWKATTDGPIRKSCLLDGEVYDARKELPGWDRPGFDDSSWQTVDVRQRISAELVAQPNEPIRVTEELEPVDVSEPKPGMYVVDFGQNLAGACRLRVEGPTGATVTLRHAEVLNPDGTIYRDNLRMKVFGGDLGARQEDQYILRGGGEEVFEPHFTYHGFRYVEVTGLSVPPGSASASGQWSIIARVLHSALPMAGSFACSSPLLNKLMQNIVWTHRDNMHGVPTDCPQRDERLGWAGDMVAFAQPACFNMDMAAFFTKWVADLRDAQTEDGRFADVAPHPYDPTLRLSGAPAWGDVGVLVPWLQYVNYGDTRLLAEHFEAARAWVDWIHKHNPDLLWRNSRNNDYGDWLNGDTLKLEGFPKGEAEVPKDLFATAFFQRSTELVTRMAAIVGRNGDAEKYAKLAADIRSAFVRAYVKEDGRVEGNTQAGYALSLDFDLVPKNKRPAAARHMVERIDAYKGHISTGFLTTVKLMNQLTRNGRNDIAHRLINNRTIPSWGYTIDQGATTIWERWDGYVEGRGFQDPGMNSFNHYAIGAVSEWMYRTILGINPDSSSPGYRHFVLRPQPGGDLEWAKGSYDSIRGNIGVDWKKDGGTLSLAVTIPANTTATLHVPATQASDVTESGQPADAAEGVRFLRMTDGAAAYEVGSGTYHFASKTA